MLTASLVAWVLEEPSRHATPAVPTELELSWQAAAPCPDRAGVLASVLDFVGQWPTAMEPVRARAEVRGGERGGFELLLSLRSATGESHEVLRADDCGTLARIVALKVALAVDSSGVVTRLPDPPRLPDRPEPPPGPTRAPRPEPLPRPPGPGTAPPDPWHLVLGGGAGVEAGALPAAGAMVSVRAAAARRFVRLMLEGLYVAPRRAHLARAPGASADFQLFAAAASGCVVPRLEPLALPVCLGLEAGALRADPSGLEHGRTTHRVWVAAMLRLAVIVPLRGRFSLSLGLDGLVPLLRHAFVVRGGGELFVSERATVRAIAGFEVRLP
jgi:hypothetical protein